MFYERILDIRILFIFNNRFILIINSRIVISYIILVLKNNGMSKIE